jgi:hypothetical protein
VNEAWQAVLLAARARIAADREILFQTYFNTYLQAVDGGDDIVAALAEYDLLLARIDAVLPAAGSAA